jgi:hypothetical protein
MLLLSVAELPQAARPQPSYVCCTSGNSLLYSDTMQVGPEPQLGLF